MTLPTENMMTTQRGQSFAELLGAFWLDLHKNKADFRNLCTGYGELLSQQLIKAVCAVNSLGRETIQSFDRTVWRQLVIRESDLTTSDAGMAKYGDGGVYGGDTNVVMYTYGGRSQVTTSKTDISAEWVRASILCNLPVNASLVLVHGTDFWFDADNGYIEFRTNPFNLDNAPITNVYDSQGRVTDRELRLWAYENLDDLRDVSNNFGSILSLTSKSSDNFKAYINIALNIITSGCTLQYLSQLVHLAVGVACPTEEEVVQEIHTNDNELVVVTDKRAYRFSPDATAIVTVGQTVQPGDCLTDTVRIYRTKQELETLPALYVTRLFGQLLKSPVVFPNADVPLVAETVYVDGDATTKISAALLGNPDTVRKFWIDVHARGLENGTTLAQKLAHQESTVDVPVTSLPATVNPYKLALLEFLGQYMVIIVKDSGILDNKMDCAPLSIIRPLLPARTACLVLVEKTADFDYIELNATGSDTAPGILDEDGGGHIAIVGDNEFIGLRDEVPDGDPFVTDDQPVAWVVHKAC